MGRAVRLLCSAPVLREGLERLLSGAGWRVVGDGDCDVVVVLVRTNRGMSEVRDARAAGVRPVVALADHHDADLTTDVIAAGASSVLPWDCEASVMLAAIELAANGISTLETTSLRWLADHGSSRSTITDTERGWLEHLGRGITIAELAPLAGYSERSLYRQLSSLYHRLGVHDRASAIAEARRRGLL